MPRQRNEEIFEETKEAIKTVARRHMAEQSTASIGLRPIARDLDMTAPALYRYFPSLDDLITALILDAFNSNADTMAEAEAQYPINAYAERLFAALIAYRDWAFAHPVDFQLIYGNPIPGYKAPGELTVPAATRIFLVIGGILDAAYRAGLLKPLDAYRALPLSINEHMQLVIEQMSYPTEPVVVYITTVGWTRIHGMVWLEMFGHTPPVVGDPTEFYRFEVLELMRSMGLEL
jgi:AcrR family transcriptional regulator